jgi:hypothetical protein
VKVVRHLSTFTAHLLYFFGQNAKKIGPSGFEPLTSFTPSKKPTVASGNLSQLTTTSSARCTSRCTETGNEPNADPLAGFVASLTPADRPRLVALLTGQAEGGAETASSLDRLQTTGEPGEETEA